MAKEPITGAGAQYVIKRLRELIVLAEAGCVTDFEMTHGGQSDAGGIEETLTMAWSLPKPLGQQVSRG